MGTNSICLFHLTMRNMNAVFDMDKINFGLEIKLIDNQHQQFCTENIFFTVLK